LLGLDIFGVNPKTGDIEANTSDYIGAINWAIANKDAYNICVISMSFGGAKSFSKPCGTLPDAIAIQAARDAGIVSVVSSGNQRFKKGLSQPACAPAAVSVGAVYTSSGGSGGGGNCFDRGPLAADQVTCYSNSASYLTMLAPGDYVTAIGITQSGTSFAAPHVSGAVAVLKAAAAWATPDDIQSALTKAGKPVFDKANKITKPRLDLLRSLNILLDGALLTINGGAVGTNLRAVSLSPVLLRSAPAGATWCASDTNASPNDCCATAAFTGGNLTATLASPGDGNKTVNFFLRGGDGCGAPLIAKAQASILLEATPPSNVNITVVQGATYIDGVGYLTTNKVQVQITAEDAGGVTQMCISYSASAKALTKCKWEPFSPAPVALKLKTFQGRHVLRVTVRDTFGNEASAEQQLVRDTVKPKMRGKLQGVAGGGGNISLSWTAAEDAVGVAAYILVYRPAKLAPPSQCSTAPPVNGPWPPAVIPVPLAPGPGVLSADVGGLMTGTYYSFRLCARDAAGNVASGLTWGQQLA
jgi:hypothetical protein